MSDVSFDPTGNRANGFSYQQGLVDTATRRRAGAALGSGDYSSAASALGAGGLIGDAVTVGNAGRAQATSRREIDKAEHDEQVKFTLQAAQALAKVPADRRAEVYAQTIRPVMAQFGFDEAELAQMDAADKSDESLNGLVTALGGTTPLASAGDRMSAGGRIVRPNAEGGYEEVYVPPVDPLEQEFLQSRIAATRAQVSQREASAAKSNRGPAPRGGSRSRSSSGGSRSGSSSLPAGFRID